MSCNLPKIILVKNDKQIANSESFLSDILEKKVYIDKLGFSNDAMRYVFLIYQADSPPTEDIIKNLLSEKKIKIDMESTD